MAKNKALQQAAKAQQDEFYTDIRDIEHELYYYMPLFRGKTVLCNCDDPYESAFFEYFATSFNPLGLKKLIATCYAGSPIAQRQLSLFEPNIPPQERKPYCAEITSVEDFNGDGRKDLLDVEYILKHNVGGKLRILEGDGDFRSPECVKFLKEADIVVTNPPFSLFREFVALLMKYDKQFLIIGSQNAITYKEIFPLIMQNKIWMGVGFMGGNAYFRIPKYNPEKYAEGVYDPEKELVKFRNVRWFTNMEHGRHTETLMLVRSYYEDPSKYPKYDNYDAIEVSKVVDIPCDYLGVMGVPVTFLDKYNPKQFEIVGRADANIANEGNRFHIEGFNDKGGAPIINGKFVYKRILIRRIGDIK